MNEVYSTQAAECEFYFKLGFASGMAAELETQELLNLDVICKKPEDTFCFQER